MLLTDEDIEAAIAAGALSSESAASLRGFVESRRAAPAADEESFRLLTGFNDIFVAIATIMVLSALAWLVGRSSSALGALAVAAASWGLAEVFTRRRRMALPSILLLLAFVGGVAFAVAIDLNEHWRSSADHRVLGAMLTGLAGALAAFAHWRRFMVPITVAAGALSLGVAAAAIVSVLNPPKSVFLWFLLAEGLVAFALALAWDMSDPERKTRRSDVAFWLHMLAAPAIVHSAFSLLGLTRMSLFGFGYFVTAPVGSGAIVAALALYAALALVALIVDRRAPMVSALAYLLFAMRSLFEATGALTTALALSALIVGAALLLLSAFWAPARRAALRLVPSRLRIRLPPAA